MDSEVIADFVATVRKHFAYTGGAIRCKHYVLVTHDDHFLIDAKREYRQKVAGEQGTTAERVLTFGKTWVRSGDGPSAVFIQVFKVNNTGSKDRDLYAILDHCRQLRHTEVPRPL